MAAASQGETGHGDGGGITRRPDDSGSGFAYTRLPCVTGFDALTDPACYAALPDDWMIGLADVVTSTAAIEAGRYKEVNTAGAAVVSAVSNALGTLDFPFVFGGDGASFAVAPEQAEVAGRALAATVAWVGQALGLSLRGGMIAVGDIRAAGHDVRVARYAASENVVYAMFSGGGRAWAEERLKAGAIDLPPAPPEARPDLTGLSCRFKDIAAANGLIVSLIVRPAGEIDDGRLGSVLNRILDIAGREPGAARPVRDAALALQWPPKSLPMEARLQRRGSQSPLTSLLAVAARNVLVQAVFRLGVDVGRFSPRRYRRQLVDNSDFRKFDDGLMMTLDCTPAAADRIEALLVSARAAGIARFGLHRQSAALVTCMVPSALRPDHIHFVDGAAGGYAMAARDLKSAAL